MLKDETLAGEARSPHLTNEQDYFDQWVSLYFELYPAGTRLDLEFRFSRLLVLAGRSWITKIDKVIRSATGQTRARWQILFALAFAEQPVTITELCRRLRVQWPTVVRVAERLSRDGLIVREENAADGRSKLISLTESGMEMVHRIQPILDRERAAILARLSKSELRECTEMLERVFEDTIRVRTQ